MDAPGERRAEDGIAGGIAAPASFWQRPPERAETVIVGGGITGVSLAHWLGRLGGEPVLLEGRHLAAGASGRSAGFLLAGVAANYQRAVDTYGRATAGEIWTLTQQNHRLLAEALRGHEVGYRRRGSWTVAAGVEEARSLEAAADLLREDGFEAGWRSDLPGPLSAHPGGLLNPADGEVDPQRVVLALGGGPLFQGAAVTIVAAGMEGVRLEVAGGQVRADRVILATNAYTARLLPGVPIRPLRAQMLASAPAPAAADRPVYADWGRRYWRQLADGRLLVGGYRDRAPDEEVGYGLAVTDRIQRHLDAHLRGLGGAVPVTHRWAGTMGFTPDELPLVGEVPGHPNLFVCAGYSGHGMGFAFNCARLLAEHLQGGPEPPRWLSPGRFGP